MTDALKQCFNTNMEPCLGEVADVFLALGIGMVLICLCIAIAAIGHYLNKGES